MGHYASNGYLFDEGEIPQCDFCGRNAEEVTIFETPHSGILLCEKIECLQSYARDNIYQEQVEYFSEGD